MVKEILKTSAQYKAEMALHQGKWDCPECGETSPSWEERKLPKKHWWQKTKYVTVHKCTLCGCEWINKPVGGENNVK